MVIHAPAKVNLFLELKGKLPSGYHELDTVMACVSWFDSLSFCPIASPNRRIDLRVVVPRGDQTTAADIPLDSRNLVVRALEALQAESGYSGGMQVTLVKRIPSQAGLGGGSSDAAAALLGGNQAWGLGLTHETLHRLAASLGSDVPFFLDGGTARCQGRGEVIEPLADAPPLILVIAKPPIGLSTAEVFRRCTLPAKPHCGEAMRCAWEKGNRQEIAASLFNRLAEPATTMTDRIAELGRGFQQTGCLGWALTGSGSACFGVYSNWPAALRASHRLRRDPATQVKVVRTLTRRVRRLT